MIEPLEDDVSETIFVIVKEESLLIHDTPPLVLVYMPDLYCEYMASLEPSEDEDINAGYCPKV